MSNLVFIHGTGDDHRAWYRQREFFAGSHAVLDVDLPARGRRAEERPFLDGPEDNARHVLCEMDAAGMSQAILIGHSDGGAVAMLIALQAPDRVLGLVLVATDARLDVGRLDAIGRVPAIAPPTLVIGCSDDRLVPVALAKALAASIPGAELVILAGCGHTPHVEQAPVFNFTLLMFMGRVSTLAPPLMRAG